MHLATSLIFANDVHNKRATDTPPTPFYSFPKIAGYVLRSTCVARKGVTGVDVVPAAAVLKLQTM